MGLPEWNVWNIHTLRLGEPNPNCQYLFGLYGISIRDPRCPRIWTQGAGWGRGKEFAWGIFSRRVGVEAQGPARANGPPSLHPGAPG
jgi:hypothetical protein